MKLNDEHVIHCYTADSTSVLLLLLVCYCYRPLSCNVYWLSDFSDSMDKYFLKQKECIVLGDFNFDILKSVGSSRVWLELMESFNYSQLGDKPTRISQHSSTLIDHIFSNAPNNIASISVAHYSISDHLPVCLTRINAFLSDLAQQFWSYINSYEEPSAAVQFFNDIFLSLLDKHAPLKKCQQPGWMNQEILNSPSKLETNFTIKKI